MIVENTLYGMINFTELINLNQSLDLDTYIEIANNSISINSSALPQLNYSAILTLYNLAFVNPIILIDGSECNSSICTRISYTNNTLIFNVTHFTTYSVSKGLYCGDGVCSNGETCSICPADCGTCTTPSRSGGTSRTYECNDRKDNDNDGLTDWPADPGCENRYDNNERDELCIESWSCSLWYECVNNQQARTCVDINSCGTTKLKPAEKRICIEKIPENITKIPTIIPEINAGKVTGKTIEIFPYKVLNPYYIIPTILLLIILIAIVSLRKTNLSKKIKNLIALLHITLVIIISLLLFTSFMNMSIVELITSKQSLDAAATAKNVINSPINTAIVIVTMIIILLSFTLFINKLIKQPKKKRSKK